ncbi:hypothetical protein GY973_24225, partial [Escherichia coli]|uniref:hypothetical protein n=1 Tax=Escherichia coli TaxID=562 RepID=UPI0015C4D65A|nr:hypothetical protein [Escherichia coli]
MLEEATPPASVAPASSVPEVAGAAAAKGMIWNAATPAGGAADSAMVAIEAAMTLVTFGAVR